MIYDPNMSIVQKESKLSTLYEKLKLLAVEA
jgi:hypothetical protein